VKCSTAPTFTPPSTTPTPKPSSRSSSKRSLPDTGQPSRCSHAPTGQPHPAGRSPTSYTSLATPRRRHRPTPEHRGALSAASLSPLTRGLLDLALGGGAGPDSSGNAVSSRAGARRTDLAAGGAAPSAAGRRGLSIDAREAQIPIFMAVDVANVREELAVVSQDIGDTELQRCSDPTESKFRARAAPHPSECS
jgi:hypothetical protein